MAIEDNDNRVSASISISPLAKRKLSELAKLRANGNNSRYIESLIFYDGLGRGIISPEELEGERLVSWVYDKLKEVRDAPPKKLPDHIRDAQEATLALDAEQARKLETSQADEERKTTKPRKQPKA